MQTPAQTLVVSHPPHTLTDSRKAAEQLGLSPVELVLKAHYPIPEIWLARDDAGPAAAELRDAGLTVKAVPAAEFALVPEQDLVASFAFGERALTVTARGGLADLPYEAPLTIVACSPRDGGAPAPLVPGEGAIPSLRPHTATDGSGAWGVFADLYATRDGRLVRYGVSMTATDFAALPGSDVAGPAGRLTRFLQECQGRFRKLVVDRRLMQLQLRRRKVEPPRGVQRKGFAFGTEALSDLLGTVAPGSRDMSQCELGSRLVYLTRR